MQSGALPGVENTPRDDTVAPFDALAGDYDRSFTHSALGLTLRRAVWARLEFHFSACRRVLELGCGTGEDAVRLASLGVDVVALDSSAQMLRIAAAKARAAGCTHRIEFLHLAMEDIATLPAQRLFDGVFSNFGALNCACDLTAVANELARRLPPGAPLLWTPMGRHVPWEWLWYLVRGNPCKAFRRYALSNTRWRGLTLRYPTPAEIRNILRPHFEITRTSPLGFALPPTFATAWLDRSPRILHSLSQWETFAQRCSWTANWADHYMVEAKRRGLDGQGAGL